MNGMLAVARGIVGDLDGRILGTAQLLYGLARVDDLDTDDRAACSAFLSEVRETHPQYTGILTIKPDGHLFCDSLGTGRELDLNDRRYFQEARATTQGIALQAAFGRLTGVAVLQIARPVRAPSGALRFVLLASFNLQAFAESSRVTLEAPDTELLLVDSEGTVMAWLPETARPGMGGESIADTALFRFAMAQAAGGVGVLDDAAGDAYVWAAVGPSEEPDTGLHVLVGRSRAALIADANERLIGDMLLIVAVWLALLAGVWVLAEIAIRNQVGRIAAMAARLADGDLGARIPAPHPGGELGGLMAVLNQTAESLEAQRAEIDELDRRLRQAQKMEAIGQLTGGIAHDFNNLLTVILGNAELLVDSLAHQPELRGLAEMSATAAERGAELTGRLLAFARLQALDPRAVEVDRLVDDMSAMLRRTLGEQIGIETVYAKELCRGYVDRGQLEAALLNLCINARDAMADGGHLTIELANAELDEDYAQRHGDVTPGRYLMIAVSDTGTGMTPEVLAHAFEPFFTTKEVGKGSGLGLSMVYGFIKQSEGHVNIYSEPGGGTTVRLYVPCAETEAAVVQDAARDEAAPGGDETILLVEDDEMVRAFVARQLEGLGYRVLQAVNGQDALTALEREPGIDLLFTDVVMPGGMGGRELAEAAHAMRPDLPVLFTSGYTENAIVHQGRLDAGVHLLNKPYRRTALARKVRLVLDGPA